MARQFDPVVSRPHRVIFAGFESTTTRLQQAGWRIAAEQSFHESSVQLMLSHQAAGLYMVAESARFDFMADWREREQLTFVIRRIARSLESVRCDADFSKFGAVDAMPQMRIETHRIEDFAIFAAPLVRTEEIIVEPQSVAECLAMIHKLQAPQLAEIRKRNAARERNEAVNQTRFHAQILSLAA